jgi:hypothetical protein
MATAIQRRRGTTSQHASFTGLVGEITIDTDLKTIRVHDGATAGGFALARADGGVQYTGNLIPSANNTYSLGSATSVWKDIYVGANTLFIDGVALTVANGSLLVGGVGVTGDITAVTAGDGLTGGGSSGDVTLNIGAGPGITVNADNVSLTPNVVTAGDYGAANTVPAISVDTYGRVTGASNVGIAIAAVQVTDFITAANAAIEDYMQAGNGLTYGSGIYTVGQGSGIIVNTSNVSVDDTYIKQLISVTDNGGDGSLSYNSTSGVITYTGPSQDDANLRIGAFISVLDSGGDGSLAFNSTTGVITYTGPNQSEANARIDARLSGGTGVTYATGVISIGQDVAANANVSFNRISNLLTPTDPNDAANKSYVDEVAQGIVSKPAVEIATTANLTATYNNGTSGVGATLTATSNGAFPEIDGITLTSTTPGENGVLVKNQTSAAQNGRYNLTQVGDGSNPWILTRCGLCDEADEIPGAYVFVKRGTLYAGTGWVQTVSNPSTFTVGTDSILVTQFSGAGTYTAGDALTLNGTEFNVVTAASGGIEIVADALQLKSSVAGNGLTYASGVIAVGAGTGLTVGADDVAVNATYIKGLFSATDAGGDGSFSYSDGVFTYTGPSASEVRAHISVTDAGGDGSLSYNSGTGVITYTGPSASEVRAHFSAGTGVTITDGAIAIGQAVGTGSNVTFNNVTASANSIGNLTGNVTGNVTGNLTGNAGTATKLATARTIALSGDVTGSTTFDGSGDVTISATIAANSVALGTDTTGNYVASVANGNYITGGSAGSEGATLTLAVDATTTATASKVVARDASGDVYANIFNGTATAARYADLAERYEADDLLEPGTVVCFGGAKEITACDHDNDHAVAGVISTDPAYMMNSGAGSDATHPYVALTGRVPVKVYGQVNKGDLLVASNIKGHAIANNNARAGTIIGKAIGSNQGGTGVIEVLVNLM